MMRPPPFTALRAFDAAARHLSFRDAAAELGVTPTAISHQIRRLEKDAGVDLFVRSVRRVALTDAGANFAGELKPALRQIEEAFTALQKAEDRPTVVIGAGPIFLSRWLAPKLTEFAARHAQIDLRLHNSPSEIWRRADEFDIAIAWGDGKWRGVDAQKLFTPKSVPLAAPKLAETLSGDAGFATAPLLHHRSRATWEAWLSRHASPPPSGDGVVFEDANVMTYAALSGRGVMLGCPELLADDISAGRLIRLSGEAMTGNEAYHVLGPARPDTPHVLTVRKWLLGQAEAHNPR